MFIMLSTPQLPNISATTLADIGYLALALRSYLAYAKYGATNVTRLTLARLAASTAKIVSIKESLTFGPQIGDIKNKSFPRNVF